VIDATLYLLATRALCRRPLFETIRLAIEGGVEAVQLREKEATDAEFEDLAGEVGEVVRAAGALFIVNDRVEIAARMPCDGIHVGQEDRPVPEVRRIVGDDARIGLSTHSVEQALEAVALGADYVGIGPTFPTTTKETGYSPRGVALAGEVTTAVPVPAFAIGGINAVNLPALISAGVRRIAVSSAICAAGDPRAAAAELATLLNSPADPPPA
jgi:thiamine-phosphate pyrophosphorylase